MRPTRRHLRVLIADDEPTVRMAVRLTLEERGHEVCEAEDATEALALAKSDSFDALIVDVRMPGGGLNLLERLRDLAVSDETSRNVADRSILLTADLSRPDVIRLIDEGQPHMRKPFQFDELVEMVERVAGEAPPAVG